MLECNCSCVVRGGSVTYVTRCFHCKRVYLEHLWRRCGVLARIWYGIHRRWRYADQVEGMSFCIGVIRIAFDVSVIVSPCFPNHPYVHFHSVRPFDAG